MSVLKEKLEDKGFKVFIVPSMKGLVTTCGGVVDLKELSAED